MIFIEGVDNSGKTTLIERLEKAGYRTDKSPHELKGMINFEAETQLNQRGKIWDRGRVISECIYGNVLRDGPAVDKTSIMRFIEKRPLIIFCRPADKYILSNNGRAQMAGVLNNHKALIDAYDELMRELVRFGVRVVKYDWVHQSTYEHVIKAIDEELDRQRAVEVQALKMTKPDVKKEIVSRSLEQTRALNKELMVPLKEKNKWQTLVSTK